MPLHAQNCHLRRRDPQSTARSGLPSHADRGPPGELPGSAAVAATRRAAGARRARRRQPTLPSPRFVYRARPPPKCASAPRRQQCPMKRIQRHAQKAYRGKYRSLFLMGQALSQEQKTASACPRPGAASREAARAAHLSCHASGRSSRQEKGCVLSRLTSLNCLFPPTLVAARRLSLPQIGRPRRNGARAAGQAWAARPPRPTLEQVGATLLPRRVCVLGHALTDAVAATGQKCCTPRNQACFDTQGTSSAS